MFFIRPYLRFCATPPICRESHFSPEYSFRRLLPPSKRVVSDYGPYIFFSALFFRKSLVISFSRRTHPIPDAAIHESETRVRNTSALLSDRLENSFDSNVFFLTKKKIIKKSGRITSRSHPARSAALGVNKNRNRVRAKPHTRTWRPREPWDRFSLLPTGNAPVEKKSLTRDRKPRRARVPGCQRNVTLGGDVWKCDAILGRRRRSGGGRGHPRAIPLFLPVYPPRRVPPCVAQLYSPAPPGDHAPRRIGPQRRGGGEAPVPPPPRWHLLLIRYATTVDRRIIDERFRYTDARHRRYATAKDPKRVVRRLGKRIFSTIRETTKMERVIRFLGLPTLLNRKAVK